MVAINTRENVARQNSLAHKLWQEQPGDLGSHAVVHKLADTHADHGHAAPKAFLSRFIVLQAMSGVELLARVKDAGAMVPAIVITGHGDVPMAVAAMKAGAVDFIEKPFEDSVLIDAIQRAAQLLDRAPDDTLHVPAFQARLEQLSERERQVFIAVVAGLPNKTIAYDLGISPRTVEVHRANVMSKMQARSLPELVRMALVLNLDGRNL